MSEEILVIEDEEHLRLLYRSMLEMEGYKITEAADGQEGFRLATTNDYKVVISDLKMPNWDGVDSILSMAMVKPATKFIVVTGYIESDLGDDVRASPNVVGMFSKPIDIPALLEAIKSALS